MGAKRTLSVQVRSQTVPILQADLEYLCLIHLRYHDQVVQRLQKKIYFDNASSWTGLNQNLKSISWHLKHSCDYSYYEMYTSNFNKKNRAILGTDARWWSEWQKPRHLHGQPQNSRVLVLVAVWHGMSVYHPAGLHYGTFHLSWGCWNWNITGDFSHHRGYWCPGSLNHQDISNHSSDCSGISIIFVISVLRNGTNCIWCSFILART